MNDESSRRPVAGRILRGAAEADRFAGISGLLFDQAMAQTRMVTHRLAGLLSA